MTVASPRHRELGLTDREYELIVEHMEREPNEVELAVFSLMWSEHCAYKHSKRLLRSLPVEGGRVRHGPGGERRRGLARRRARVRVQGRVAQPPERGRAVPGRRHRRRRHPARRLRGRRAADRDPRLAALRRGLAVAAVALPARAGGRRHRPLRQLDRRRHRRRRDLLRGLLRGQLPRQRDVPRADPGGRPDPLGGGRGRQRRAAVRRAHRPRRDRRRVGAGFARSSTSSTPPSARPSRSATRSRRRSCSSARSSCSSAGCSSRCRTSARPASPRRAPRWRARARSGWTSTSARSRCARPTWSPSRS